MNNCFLWLVVCCGLSMPLWAQDQPDGQVKAPARPAAKAAGTNEVLEIFSDSFEYDSSIGRAVYTGHVRVNDPEMTIDCELLTVSFARTEPKVADGTGTPAKPGGLSAVAGGKIETIVAEKKVVIVNRKDGLRATGAKAIYTAATDVVELTGNPTVEQPQGTLDGAEVVVLDRARGRLVARGGVHMQLRPDAMKREKSTIPKAGPAKPRP